MLYWIWYDNVITKEMLLYWFALSGSVLCLGIYISSQSCVVVLIRLTNYRSVHGSIVGNCLAVASE